MGYIWLERAGGRRGGSFYVDWIRYHLAWRISMKDWGDSLALRG